jgi:hypothetical protein
MLFNDIARTSPVASPFSAAWALAVALSTLTMLSFALSLAAQTWPKCICNNMYGAIEERGSWPWQLDTHQIVPEEKELARRTLCE